MTPDERRTAIAQIADEVSRCRRCPLSATRTNPVPGEGHPDTEVVFVGEGPGFNEDQQGRPFVGAAGNLLGQLLREIGWRRDEVFITNVVKCRPPGNRDPEPNEVAACAPFLTRQLEVLDPALVVTLGRHSLQTFRPGARISQVHGTQAPADPTTGAADATAFAMYHPAAALRQHSLRETMLADMARLPQALLDSRARRAAARQPTAAGSDEVTRRAPQSASAAVTPTIDAPGRGELEPVGVAAARLDPTPAGNGEPDPDNQMELF